jgi:tetratricopeptide (TPR) repeat protein
VSVVLALCAAQPAGAQGVVIAGTIGTPETDLTPEQEQRLLNEYWTNARKYKADPAATVAAFSVWTRDRIAKAQSIQFQPETPGRPDYLESKAEWNPATLRLAAMLHTDLGLAAFQQRRMMDFDFHIGIADGWLILADNKLSAPGSFRAKWTVTVARFLLASGEIGVAERILNRAAERIGGDVGILLAQATVKETQASRLVAEISGGRLDEPSAAVKGKDAALAAAQSALERVLKLQPSLVEPKLRLAHIMVLKHDDARASSLASEVIAAKPQPMLKYVASLIAGGVLERGRQYDAAARAYLDAILAVPDGQTGYIALANIMHHSGQAAEAAAVLERMYSRGATNAASDPWIIYPLGFDLSMDAQFEEYRNLVRK